MEAKTCIWTKNSKKACNEATCEWQLIKIQYDIHMGNLKEKTNYQPYT